MATMAPLEVKVVAKIHGMWRLALLTFLLRLKSAKHEIHVTIGTKE